VIKKMKLGLLALLFVFTACNANKQQSIDAIVYKSSENLSANIDNNAITASLFAQFRPRVVINDLSLSEAEIDKAVKEYISKNYTPVLIENYSQIFTELKKYKKDFSNCKEIVPLDDKSETLKSLCIIKNENEATINYMTKGSSKGWQKNAAYTFLIKANVATLSSIDVNMHNDTKVNINGI